MKDRYLVIVGGEIYEDTESKKDAFMFAHNYVDQHITDFLKHDLPIKINEDMIRKIDVYVAKISNEDLVELPYQQWADEYYKDLKEDEKYMEEQEYKWFLELYEKFKDRLP